MAAGGRGGSGKQLLNYVKGLKRVWVYSLHLLFWFPVSLTCGISILVATFNILAHNNSNEEQTSQIEVQKCASRWLLLRGVCSSWRHTTWEDTFHAYALIPINIDTRSRRPGTWQGVNSSEDVQVFVPDEVTWRTSCCRHNEVASGSNESLVCKRVAYCWT